MELAELILKHIKNSMELKKAMKTSLEIALIRNDLEDCEKYTKEIKLMNETIDTLMEVMDIELNLKK